MSNTKKKLITTIFAMAVIIASFVYGTVAYFTDSVTSTNSVIATGSAKASVSDVTFAEGSSVPLPSDAEIDVLPGAYYTKSVSATNTGSYPIYVRGKIDCKITLSEKNAGREDEIDYSLVIPEIDAENWIFHDGYYYYKESIRNGETTTSLVNSISFSTDMDNMYKSSKVYFKVRIEIVQANNNGTNAFNAVGWPTDSQGGDA